jgi:hypothetical protein
MKSITIPISAIVGSGFCVTTEDAHKVHDQIASEIASGNKVILSFSGITRMTTAFLNVAIGQLYGEFSEEKLRMHMAPPVDADPWHLTRLKMVVDRAKVYFNNKDNVEELNRNLTNLDE